MARTSRLRLLTDEALTDLAEAVVVDMAVENVALAVVAAAEASADTRDVADMVSAVEKDEEVIINFILYSGDSEIKLLAINNEQEIFIFSDIIFINIFFSIIID